jgi:hypothetical protein
MCAALLHTRQTTENESSAHFSFFLAETLIAFLVGIFLVDFVLFGSSWKKKPSAGLLNFNRGEISHRAVLLSTVLFLFSILTFLGGFHE